MKSLITKLIVILAVMLGYSAIAQADTSKLIIFKENVLFKHNVVRVYASGKYEKVLSVKGPPSTLMISPDQNYIIYNLENDLWLLNLQTKQTKRLTNAGEPITSRYAEVIVMGKLWSRDSNKFIYSVVAGDTDDPEGGRPDLKVRSAKYGTYLYDLRTNISKPIELPEGYILFWLEDGNFLINITGKKVQDDKIVIHDVIKNIERPLILRGIGQTDLSYDGEFILTNIHNKMKTSQLVRIDMTQERLTYITPVGKWAEYQWPKFSPSAKRISYEHRTGTSNNRCPVSSLVVDGNDIYKHTGSGTCYLRYDWIDESTIVILEETQKEIIIIDVDTGKEKGRHSLKE